MRTTSKQDPGAALQRPSLVPARKHSLATRIAAVVHAAFDFRIPEAAEKFGVEPWQLFAIMAGDWEPTPEFLTRLVEIAQCPRSWIEAGDLQLVPAPLAERMRAFLDEGGAPSPSDVDDGSE